TQRLRWSVALAREASYQNFGLYCRRGESDTVGCANDTSAHSRHDSLEGSRDCGARPPSTTSALRARRRTHFGKCVVKRGPSKRPATSRPCIRERRGRRGVARELLSSPQSSGKLVGTVDRAIKTGRRPDAYQNTYDRTLSKEIRLSQGSMLRFARRSSGRAARARVRESWIPGPRLQSFPRRGSASFPDRIATHEGAPAQERAGEIGGDHLQPARMFGHSLRGHEQAVYGAGPGVVP